MSNLLIVLPSVQSMVADRLKHIANGLPSVIIHSLFDIRYQRYENKTGTTLKVLELTQQGVRPGDIAKQLNIHPSNVSTCKRRLRKKGLLP